MKNRIVWIVVAGLLVTAGIVGWYTLKEEPKDMLAANLAAMQSDEVPDYTLRSNDTLLHFESPAADLGRLKMTEKKEVVFRFANVSSEPVVITRVMTTCECTSAEWEKSPLMPGQKSEIKVAFEAKEAGSFFKKLFVYYAGAATPLEIAIKGEVK